MYMVYLRSKSKSKSKRVIGYMTGKHIKNFEHYIILSECTHKRRNHNCLCHKHTIPRSMIAYIKKV